MHQKPKYTNYGIPNKNIRHWMHELLLEMKAKIKVD